MAIRQDNLRNNNTTNGYRLIGVASSVANYLGIDNRASANEGDTYYDTTLNQLRTYDGSSWSPAGMSGGSAGSLNSAAGIGGKITIDGSTVSSQVEIECSVGGLASGALLNLDNDDTTNDPICLDIDNAADSASAVSIDIDGAAGYDIQGTSDTWNVTIAGLATFGGGLDLLDDDNLRFGSSQDIVIDWDQTKFNITGATANSEIRIGDATNLDVRICGGTTSANVLFDSDDSALVAIFEGWDLRLNDDDILNFGDSSDVTATWDQTNLLVEAATDNTGQIRVGSTNSLDVAVYGSTNTNIALFDVNETTYGSLFDLNGWDIRLQDDDQLIFGDSSDVIIDWDQTKLVIACDDGRVDLGVAGAGFDMYWYSETSGDHIYWDEDNARVDYVDVDLRLDDDAYLYFGSDSDVSLTYDETNTELDISGNVNITGTLTVSGAMDLANYSFGDDEELRMGNSNDFVLHYDSSNANLELDAAAANDQFDIGATTATDVLFNGANAGRDAHWDASANTLGILDDALIGFGNTAAAPDVSISWDQTRLNFSGSGKQVRFGADDEGMDVLFYGETASAQMLWDESADQLVIGDSGASVDLQDDVKLLLGTGATNAGDFSIYSDGTDLFITEIASAGKIVKVGTSGKGLDLQLYGDDAGQDLLWDQSADLLHFADNAVLGFGSATAGDITMKWDTSDLLIEWATQDAGIIKFGATDSGDVNFYANTATSYASFDSGAAELILEGYDLGLQDDDILQFGDSNDITMTWDQSKLMVTGAAANSEIRIGDATNLDLRVCGGTTSANVLFDSDDSALVAIFEGWDLRLNDDDQLFFGDSSDIVIDWDQTRLMVTGAAANSEIRIGDSTNLDLRICGGTTSNNVLFDTDDSALLCTFDGFDLQVNDDDILQFGDAGTSDCYITWDQTQLQVVPSSAVFIGDKTNYTSIDATGDIAMTGTASITCGLGDTTNFNGLVIPYHATSSAAGTPGGGAIFFEGDASKLWVYNAQATAWVGQVLT